MFIADSDCHNGCNSANMLLPHLDGWREVIRSAEGPVAGIAPHRQGRQPQHRSIQQKQGILRVVGYPPSSRRQPVRWGGMWHKSAGKFYRRTPLRIRHKEERAAARPSWMNQHRPRRAFVRLLDSTRNPSCRSVRQADIRSHKRLIS